MSTINPIASFELPTNRNSVYGRYNGMYTDLEPRATTNWPIREAFVESVNKEDYSCTIKVSGGGTYTIPYVSPWFNRSTGKGIVYHPESGSRVLVAKAESSQWYILGFLPLINIVEENYKNYRADIEEGDIDISTDANNFIRITKTDQTIILQNSPACKILMTSSKNKISVLSQQLFIENRAGCVWMISDTCEDPVEDPETGMLLDRPVDVCTTGLFKMNTADYDNFVKIDIGKVSLNNEAEENVILALNICNKVSITVDTDGNITTYTRGKQQHLAVGDVLNTTKGKMTISSVGNMNIDSDGSVVTQASGNIEETAGGTISNNAASVTHGRGSASPGVSSIPYPEPDDSAARRKMKSGPFTLKASLVP